VLENLFYQGGEGKVCCEVIATIDGIDLQIRCDTIWQITDPVNILACG
jgi:hypothetical protein